jgi:hypothetical protein
MVVANWGYGAAFMIAGSVGVACAFISIFLKQPKLKHGQGAPTESPFPQVTRDDERTLVKD